MKARRGEVSILFYVSRRVLPIMLPIMLVAFTLTYKFTYRTIQQQQQQNIKNELSFAQQTLNNRLSVTRGWLKNLAQNGMIANSLVDPKGAGEYIPQLFKTLRVPGPQSGGSIKLLDYQGRVLATNSLNTAFTQPNDNWQAAVMNGQYYESIDHNGLIMAEPIIINGLPEGILVLLFDATTLAEFLKVYSVSSYLFVADTHGYLLFTSPEQNYFHVGHDYDEKHFADWAVYKQRINAASELMLVSARRNNILFQAVTDVQYAMVIFIILAFCGIFLSISLVGRSVAAILDNVSDQLRILHTEKNLSKRIKLSTIKELAGLERSYNELAEELQDTTVSKEYIDTLFNGMPLPVFVVKPDGFIVRTNESALSLFKDTNSEIPTYFQEMILHDDLEKHQEELIKHFAYTPPNAGDTFFYLARKHNRYEMEMRLIAAKGDIKPYILSATSLKDHKNKLTGYIITATDIQDRKQQEKEIMNLAEQNTLMARAIEEIDLGVTISDGRQPHQPIIFCNQAFMDISGRKMEEILGFSCGFMQGAETDPAVIQKLSEAINNQNSIRVEILNYKKSGEAFWNELSLNPILGHDGRLKYYVGIQNDITERKRVEAMKKEFISTVSHELRTPLTSIHGSLGLINDLYDSEMPAEEKELLSIAYRNSERLKFLVDDILDIEKLEAGEMRFYPEKYKLLDIVQQSVQLNTLYGEKYGVKFVISDDIPDTRIYVDKDRIVQVFANLLSNAAKFSKELGRVDIGAQLGCCADDMVRISITDYGDGISDDFQKRIFTKFAQQDSSDVRKVQGTGLGLYITKKIVESHDGQIDFKTKIGQGTTFYIDLPCC